MTTKKLAKELGLLRQRSQSANGSKTLSNQIFAYLIVIDFESTCWKEKTNYGQEIIEFPAVLLNTSTGEIESEFHTYVQPQERPLLSEFCTELTGIKQAQVEAGIPLQICLSRFNRWLQKVQVEKGLVFPNRQEKSSAPSPSQKPCAFVTWSDWDLGVCLQYECKRKQLHKPDVLNSWIDLRGTYRMFYDKKPKGLNGALQDLGIQFSGREHSGLDDSRNTACLAVRMMRDGCVMKITRSLEKAPSMVKPMFGNTTADSKKETSKTDKEKNTPNTEKPSSSKIPPKSRQIKSCSEDITKYFDTKENSVQSLISPQTLLNGTNTPLMGCSRMSVSAGANTSSLVRVNCPSPHNNTTSLVLCSTTLGCLSNLPNQPCKTREEEEGYGEAFCVEPEDRCGSYDDVVLEEESVSIGETEREFDQDYVSDFDNGCHVWGKPDAAHLPGGHVTLRDTIRETKSIVDNFKIHNMTGESSTTSLPTNKILSHINVSNNLHEMRPHSTISEHGTFAAPRAVPSDKSNYKTGLKASRPAQENSYSFNKMTQLLNTSSRVKHKPFVPEKTSTPFTSFIKPRAVVTQHPKPKETPRHSFTIYTDATKTLVSSTGDSLSKTVLASLSTNSLNQSSFSISKRVGQRITSPLCGCGRRAKRQLVSNGGPNHGRGFFCCPVRRSGSGGRIQKGCEFFKWESAVMKSSLVVGSSVSLCQINSSLSRPPPLTLLRKSY
ncbi:hypothetical protein CesoFtcFv8_008532 [Champsocephalus esox]|uniref:ERI1 exoribonuclease 2 n=1 Tax=Champsocephalus esox TaxID=159716 RepID=A0AAN8C7L1_9TELE|nr:hypothetical protein CesoFtcFv8_008532 [Champsocephalus esox]